VYKIDRICLNININQSLWVLLNDMELCVLLGSNCYVIWYFLHIIFLGQLLNTFVVIFFVSCSSLSLIVLLVRERS
jgi:hypothetical protein